jgi:hypothetical protein
VRDQHDGGDDMHDEISADADFLHAWAMMKAVRRLERNAATEDVKTGLTLLGMAANYRERANALVCEGADANRLFLELLDPWFDGEDARETNAPSPPSAQGNQSR